MEYWANGYEWRVWEAAINELPSHYADIGGHQVHYLRYDGETPSAIPIVLTNGWPSTFFEMVELARRLANPSVFGVTDEVGFTAIVPSLPGFTFSDQRPMLPADVATHEIWHRLMSEELGFERYVAHGGDLGAGTTSRLAAAHPDALLGIHLMAVGAPTDVDEATLSSEEKEHLARVAAWTRDEGGYMHQQSTRPLTLAYGLSDSPAGLLAWMLDKYNAWSDNRGVLANSFSDDFLLTQASLYWFTNTIGTSFRPYYEYGRGISRGLSRVTVPTAISLFPADISQPPESWAERTHNVVHYVRALRGGHFAPRFLTSWPTTSDVSSVRCCNPSFVCGHRRLMPRINDRLAPTYSLSRRLPTSPSVMPRCARSPLRGYAREDGRKHLLIMSEGRTSR